MNKVDKLLDDAWLALDRAMLLIEDKEYYIKVENIKESLEEIGEYEGEITNV